MANEHNSSTDKKSFFQKINEKFLIIQIIILLLFAVLISFVTQLSLIRITLSMLIVAGVSYCIFYGIMMLIGVALGKKSEAPNISKKKFPADYLSIKIVGSFVAGFVTLIILGTFLSAMMAAPAQGKLAYCQTNLKNIAIALEMYAADYDGDYPLFSIISHR